LQSCGNSFWTTKSRTGIKIRRVREKNRKLKKVAPYKNHKGLRNQLLKRSQRYKLIDLKNRKKRWRLPHLRLQGLLMWVYFQMKVMRITKNQKVRRSKQNKQIRHLLLLQKRIVKKLIVNQKRIKNQSHP
jgi:hypothetical protein